ncbi:MAG: hypothetical protein QF464_19340 [Myxococcota bacterium]|nr:hypothetical protein [Myxococcota bacterium]
MSHPADLVLETMIERMHEIVPFLPSVSAIDLISREDVGDAQVRIVRRWQGTADAAPGALRPFLTDEAMAWTDTALWTPADFKVDWTLSTSMGRLYDCAGTNYFGPDPEDPEGATRMRVTGQLQVYPERLPGVPRFLGKRLAPQVEKFVVGLITPNLTDVAVGLQGYLDAAG